MVSFAGARAIDDVPSPEAAVEGYLDLADRTRVCTAGCAALFGASGDLVFSPSGDRVVYSTSLLGAGRCSSDDQLFLANADGSDARRLNPPAGLNAYLPAWSTDGTKVVYQARQGVVATSAPLIDDVAAGADSADRSRPDPAVGWPVTADVSPNGECVDYSSLERELRRHGTSGRCRSPVAGPLGSSRTRKVPCISPTAESPSSGRVRARRPTRSSPQPRVATRKSWSSTRRRKVALPRRTAPLRLRRRRSAALLDLAGGGSTALASADRFALVG